MRKIWEIEIKEGEGLWWLIGRVESLFLGIDVMEIYAPTTAVADRSSAHCTRHRGENGGVNSLVP